MRKLFLEEKDMGKGLDTLLAALATTPGDTVLEKMEKLIESGVIFTAQHETMFAIARNIDSSITMREGWARTASYDIEATRLSERLRNIFIEVSPQKVRAERKFYTPEYVASLEEIYRRGQEMQPTPHRRRMRVEQR